MNTERNESKYTIATPTTVVVKDVAPENKSEYEYYYAAYAQLRQAQEQYNQSTKNNDPVSNLKALVLLCKTRKIDELLAPHPGLRESLEETYQTRRLPNVFRYEHKHDLEQQLEAAEIRLRKIYNRHYDTDFEDHRRSKERKSHSQADVNDDDKASETPLPPIDREQRQLLEKIFDLKAELNTPIESLKVELEEAEIRLWKEHKQFTRAEIKSCKESKELTRTNYISYAQQKDKLDDLIKEQAACRDVSTSGTYIQLCKEETKLKKSMDKNFGSETDAKRKLYNKIYMLKKSIRQSQPQDPDFCQARDELDLLKDQLAEKYHQYYKDRKELHFLTIQFIQQKDNQQNLARKAEDIERLTAKLRQERQTNLDLDALLIDIDNLKNKIYQLERTKELEDMEDQRRYIKKRWLDLTQNSIDPMFQFVISIYVVLKGICLQLSDHIAKIISLTSFAIGKTISIIGLFRFYREEKTPQRKTRIAHGLLSLATAIANTTLTLAHTNPYISAMINFTTIMFGLGKESYCTHHVLINIKQLAAQLQNLKSEQQYLDKKNKDPLTPLSTFELRRLKRLDIMIKHQNQLLQQQIDQDRFESIRGVMFTAFYVFCSLTFLFTSLAACTTLFPPIALAILSKATIVCSLTQLPTTVFDVTDTIFQYRASRWLLKQATDCKNYVIELFEPKNLPGFILQAVISGLTTTRNFFYDMVRGVERSYTPVTASSTTRSVARIASGLNISISPKSTALESKSTPAAVSSPTKTDYLNNLSLDDMAFSKPQSPR